MSLLLVLCTDNVQKILCPIKQIKCGDKKKRNIKCFIKLIEISLILLLLSLQNVSENTRRNGLLDKI